MIKLGKKLILFLFVFWLSFSVAAPLAKRAEGGGAPKKSLVKTLPCDSSKNIVRVSTKKVTALSFLEAPKDLVPGDGAFDFKRVQNEIFVKALSTNANTNMFVYVGSKRCRFNLITSGQNSDELLEVREPNENVIEAKFHEE